MKNNLHLSTDTLNKLPNPLKSTYLLWQEGHDCRAVMSLSTYKRHRKQLKEYGINIDLERKSQTERQSNVIPLIRVLEAKPAEIPAWAYENNLIFDRNKTMRIAL